jgi:hypothetical protein
MTAVLLFFATFGSIRKETFPTNQVDLLTTTDVYDSPHRTEEIRCLARTIYFEARGESIAAQIAVGQVTLNRVKGDSFPDTVCGVVHEKRHGVCQYTWFCHRNKLIVHEKGLFANIMILATALYDHYYVSQIIPDIVDGAMYFQRSAHHLVGGESSVITAHIDHQFFYRVANT